jgi:Zn-dependent protease
VTDSEIWIPLLVALVPSVIVHEVMHGVVALWCGDDTARRAGRLTLNPIPHIDPFGTILLPLLLSLTSFGVIGYAKPVPVNVRKLRSPRQQALYVSLAGPAVNIAFCLLAAAVLRSFSPVGDIGRYVFYFGVVNVILAAFNLIPLPPLDGSAIIERFLPARAWPQWLKLRQYSMGILLVIVLVLPSGLSFVFEPAYDLWESLL